MKLRIQDLFVTEENSAATEEVTSSNEEQIAFMHQIVDSTYTLEELVKKLNNTVYKFKLSQIIYIEGL